MLPNNRNSFSARRLVLLGSVAAVGAALLVGAPGYQTSLPAWTSAASAANSAMQHPTGFADIVSKVKPAVISVRVKIPASAEPAMMQQQGDDDQDAIPTVPGSPMDKFFRQFGDQFGRQGRQGGQQGQRGQTPQGHQTITGEGSGFFISADGYAVTNNHVVDHAKSVQVTTDDGTIYTAKVSRHGREDRSGADQGRRQEGLSLREIRRSRAARRRLGSRGGQSVRSRRHGDGGHRFRTRSRYRRRPL